MGELKPCPFCGGEAVVLGYEPMRRAYEVCCTHCNVRLFGPEQKSRNEMWNRRTTEATLQARVEELEAENQGWRKRYETLLAHAEQDYMPEPKEAEDDD
jgi:Lar family restriction alleviation protein